MARFRFLEFLIEQEHLLPEGAGGNDGADGAGHFVVFFRIIFGDECVDGAGIRRFVHRQAADFHLDARRNVAFGPFQHGVIMDEKYSGIGVAVDMDRPESI